METSAPDHWEMERIKRRLDQFASLVRPARTVVLLGSPPASDVEGQLRADGLESLLAAHRIAVRPGTGRNGGASGSTAIWLGDAPEELDALRRRGPPARLLLWPRPEQVADAWPVLANWSGPPPILCSSGGGAEGALGDVGADRVRVLPDPAHALWGLLEHHPPGEGLLDLPDGGWDGLLPPARLAMLRRCERQGHGSSPGGFGPRLRRIARRRVLEAARRSVAAYAEVSGTRVGGSVLAALLGRGFRAAPTASAAAAARIAAYWAGWRATAAAA